MMSIRPKRHIKKDEIIKGLDDNLAKYRMRLMKKMMKENEVGMFTRIPESLNDRFKAKLDKNETSYRAWLIKEINQYLKRGY